MPSRARAIASARTLARRLGGGVGGRQQRGGAGRARVRPSSFAPDGELVPRALRAVRKGGRVICAGNPHERHPVVSLDPISGASATSNRSRTSRAATARSSCRSRPALPVTPRVHRLRARRREPRARRSARRTLHRGGGGDSLTMAPHLSPERARRGPLAAIDAQHAPLARQSVFAAGAPRSPSKCSRGRTPLNTSPTSARVFVARK